MANIFTWDVQDIDLKECVKLRTNCQQMDTMVMQFNVYDYDIPVDLTNFNITFVAKKSDGTIYGQVENITKDGKLLTITCSNQLTSVTGRAIGIIEVIDNLGNRKSSYFIVLNVSGLVSEDDRVVSRNFVDILEKFDDDVNIAVSLSTSFKADIAEAQIISDDFAIKIPQASVVNTTLNATIGNANTIQSTLNSTISTGNTLESRLISDITAGNTVKSNLEANIVTANTDNDTLTATIGNADAKLQEFKSYDTTQLVPLSNTMLNEMYCNKELLSINHGLNGYPVVKLTYTEYGAGIGGAGNFPAGADSDCNLMQNKTIYTDNNNLTLYVPQNYYIASPSINKLNDYKYIVTFLNSTRSILIELIEGTISEDIKLINDSISDLNYQTAQGTANAITLTVNGNLTNGYPLKFIANADNNGNATTINGKHCFKQNSTNAPIFKQGKAYDIWYNLSGDNFFLKANAVGNTISSHVLAGDGFSTDVDTDLIGTMPNNGAVTITPSTTNQTIALGYHNGSGTVNGDTDLISANIKAGVNIFGVQGSGTVVDTADAVLDPSYLVTGYSGYDDGVKKAGTLSNLTGTRNATGVAKWGDGGLAVYPERGYQKGGSGDGEIKVSVSQMQSVNPYLQAPYIVNGYDIFGIVGTATIASLGGRNFASNTTTASSTTKAFPNTYGTTTTMNYFSIRGLPFVPSIIIGWDSNTRCYSIYTSGSIFGAGVLYNQYNTGSSSGGGGSIMPIANSASVQLSNYDYDIPIQQTSGWDVSWWAFS